MFVFTFCSRVYVVFERFFLDTYLECVSNEFMVGLLEGVNVGYFFPSLGVVRGW